MSIMTDQIPHHRSRNARKLLADNAILMVFLLFIVFATIVSGGRFIHPANVSVILFQCSVIGVLALGQTLVTLLAGIDLSVATVAIFAAIVMGAGGSEEQQMMNLSGILPFLGFLPSMVVALAAAALVGLVNGAAVVIFRIPAFIATLAMSLALSGLSMLLTGGSPVHYPDPFFADFGATKFLTIPAPVYVFAILALVSAFLLSRSRLGIMIYAIGGNRRAASLSGIPVRSVTILAYVLCSLFGGIAGFLFLARTGSVAPTSGAELLLSTIAAVVVGGVSLAGGKGSILNAVIGTLMLAGLGNLMNIMLISSHLQDAVSGLIIVLAIMLNARLNPST